MFFFHFQDLPAADLSPSSAPPSSSASRLQALQVDAPSNVVDIDLHRMVGSGTTNKGAQTANPEEPLIIDDVQVYVDKVSNISFVH